MSGVALDATHDAKFVAHDVAHDIANFVAKSGATSFARMPPTDFQRSSAGMSAASPQSRVVVRVNQKRDDVSPVVASMYCSPHPAALHIAPAARL